MPLALTFRCPSCAADAGSFVLYEIGEAGPEEAFMFADALEETSTARLVYESAGVVGVRIIPLDELAELRTALISGPDTLSELLPELMPATCPRGHPIAGESESG